MTRKRTIPERDRELILALLAYRDELEDDIKRAVSKLSELRELRSKFTVAGIAKKMEVRKTTVHSIDKSTR